MIQKTLYISFLAFVGIALCAPTPQKDDNNEHHTTRRLAPLRRQAGSNSNKYIVTFHDNTVNPDGRSEWLGKILTKAGLSTVSAKATGDAAVTHWSTSVLNGMGATLDEYSLQALREQSEVKLVEEDVKMKKSAVISERASLVKQTNAPWGLARLSSGISPITLSNGLKDTSTAFPYTFDTSAGNGVNIYVIDTGVRDDHKDFSGRVTFLQTFGQGTEGKDVDGHGTHVAGTTAGAFFGVAKQANVFAIKVLGDDGTGDTSDIISALNLVLQNQQNTTARAVVNMSLGGNHVTALDDAVNAVVAAGIPVVVAAGNDGRNVGDDSPAGAADAITVGAMDINDDVPPFSNFGAKVDIFAPGKRILSLSPATDDSTAVLSGTSMATPHIAGLVATLLAEDPTLTPAQVKKQLLNLGVSDVLQKGTKAGTVNLVATNGFSA